MSEQTTPSDVLRFWREAGPAAWFTRDEAFDARCRALFLGAYEKARDGELTSWEQTADGALAIVILLDQMPRNMFRGDPRTWGTDPQAREIAERAIAQGFDQKVEEELRQFFYLPYMHAEDRPAQERSVALYETFGSAENRTFAKHHRDIIARFGRFRIGTRSWGGRAPRRKRPSCRRMVSGADQRGAGCAFCCCLSRLFA